MGNFDQKVNKFIEIFLEEGGYVKVVEGLQNTLLIAVAGLLIGILIGTVIASVRVLPKYRLLPRVLNGICSCLYSIMYFCRSLGGRLPGFRYLYWYSA